MSIGYGMRAALALLVASGVAAASSAQAAAAAQRQAMGQRHWQGHMAPHQFANIAVYSSENLEANVSGYFTLHGAWGITEGFGTLQIEKSSFMRGLPRRSVILLANERYLPGLTDSVRFTNVSGESRKGLPHGETWLFLERDGRIKIFARAPGGDISHFSIADSALLDLEKDHARLRRELETVPMAGYFGAHAGPSGSTRAAPRTDADLDLAVRLHNTLHGKQSASQRGGASRDALSGYFMLDSITDYTYSLIDKSDPDDFMYMSLRARYLCGLGETGKAESLLAQIDALVPDLYFTHQARGLCAQASGNLREAIRQYRIAYKTAPSGLAERYYTKIRRYQRMLGEDK